MRGLVVVVNGFRVEGIMKALKPQIAVRLVEQPIES
jgi:hypothetical protein